MPRTLALSGDGVRLVRAGVNRAAVLVCVERHTPKPLAAFSRCERVLPRHHPLPEIRSRLMPGPELGVQLLLHGYRALTRNAVDHQQEHQYPARMMGRRALVVWGSEGARLFYDEALVTRRRAVPPPLARLLFGKDAVHGLDGSAHVARKQIFLELLSATAVEELAANVRERMAVRVSGWAARGEISVFEELVECFGECVLAWAGIDLPIDEARRRSHDLAAIVDGFGGAGTAYVRGAAARRRSNRWAANLVRLVRRGDLEVAETSPLGTLALGAGAGLDEQTAGVELLNILRPTVAVAWLGTFAALALHRQPQWRTALAHDEPGVRLAYAQEVRRTAPFAPVLAGRVREPGVWRGVRFRRGDFLVLDLLSTNHDPERWPDPVRFDPSRFFEQDPGPFDLVPQGGGDPRSGHRCPGEPVALRLLMDTIGLLADTEFTIVSDPAYDPTRIPTLPGQGLVIKASPNPASSVSPQTPP